MLFIHDVSGSQIVRTLVTGPPWMSAHLLIYARGDDLHCFWMCPRVLALALASLSARHVEEHTQKLLQVDRDVIPSPQGCEFREPRACDPWRETKM